MRSSVYARTICPWAAHEARSGMLGGGLENEGAVHKDETVLFLYSLFHLCHHDHLWVLVHLQAPEGEEMLR